MTVCYIGLGSNLNQPLLQLTIAKQVISQIPDTLVTGASSIYQSQALTLNNEPQDDYLNAVLKIETGLSPESLLKKLQQLETEQGRSREKRWGSRTIDMDIILFADQLINSEYLTIPHKELKNRRFVLVPLNQITRDINIPGNASIRELIKNTENQSLIHVGEFNG